VESFLRQLIRFQELSLEASRLDARISRIPSDIKKVDQEETAQGKVVTEAKGRLAASQKGRKDFERDLQDLELKIAKYNDQSREVKTNDQYRAIMSEIDNVKVHIDGVEEKILLAMEESDQLTKKIADAERTFTERRKEHAARRGLLESERAKLASERERLGAELDALRAEIPAGPMDAYARTAQTRGELVMAQAINERCQVCGVRLRPAVFAEVRKNSSIIQCESCRRILYWVPEPAKEEAGEAPVRAADGPGGDTSPSAGSA